MAPAKSLVRWRVYIVLLSLACSRCWASTCTPEGSGEPGDCAVELAQRRFRLDSRVELDSARERAARPNILLIHPDDMYFPYLDWSGMGVDDMRTEGPDGLHLSLTPADLTPNIARTISEGTTFVRAYTTSSMCAPSRAAMMTGRYPSRNVYMYQDTKRQWQSTDYVRVRLGKLTGADQVMNMATYLNALGYLTGHVGKWDLTPSDEGGTYDYPYENQTASVEERGFSYVDGLYIENCDTPACPTCQFTHNLEWTTEKALDLMSTALNKGDPFFLYFNPTVPHTPLGAEAFTDPSTAYKTPAGILDALPSFASYCSSCSMADRADIWAASEDMSLDVIDRSNVSANYWIDQSVGVMYSFLSEKGVLDSTYIVFTTDHGDAKTTLYERGCRVPVIVRGPDVQRGVVSHELIVNIDMVPTLLEWAGGDLSEVDTDGTSWAPVASGTATSLGRGQIFLELDFDRAVVTTDDVKLYNSAQSVFGGMGWAGWTADWPWDGEEYQLYNLTSDPTEQVSLVNVSAMDTLLATLTDVLTEHKLYTKDNLPSS